MASYLVMKPPGAVRNPDSVRFIRDGFSWFALILPLIWMLLHRMWLFALLFFMLQFVLVFGGEILGFSAASSIILLGLNLLIALESGVIRERHLRSQGWTTQTIISADTIDDAEALYFHGQEGADGARAPASVVNPQPRNPWGGASLGPFESYGSV